MSTTKISNSPDEYVKACPICNRPSAERIHITNDDSYWHRCSCGVAFQNKPPKNNVYDEKYNKQYEEMKEFKYRSLQAYETYIPFIEDITHGRKILEVGCNTTKTKKYFNDRGWIYFGMDVNDSLKSKKRFIKGDFETFEFHKDHKFDVIWMSHVFEHFLNPVSALEKCYNILGEDGVIFIATPDIDWINNLGISGWGHWNKDEHYIFWNIRSLKKQLEAMGFAVYLQRRNFSTRYTSWHDLHMIAQKVYF